MKKYIWNKLSATEQKLILQRPVSKDQDNCREQTQKIIAQVQQQGDSALIHLTQQYEGVCLTNFAVTAEEFSAAYKQVDSKTLAAIKFAYQQIETQHALNLPSTKKLSVIPGVACERQPRPIQRVGLYVPGGSAPLVSTALMLGVPSRLANCPLRVLCTPANKEGKINPYLLVAASLSGIDQIYKLGGAQAIAAMAYGTESIPKVDKLFGPGNAWVTQAKILVAQDPLGAAIDMPAGPSELLVIADAEASPEFVAADLLSQAEHGPDSQVILITLSEKFAIATEQALEKQLKQLSRYLIAEKSLLHARIIIVETAVQAIAISNHYAPEHLILQVAQAEQYVEQIQNAGAVFLGAWAPETVGDYVTGSNHVLPTSGYARNHSGLSVLDFMKFINVQTVTKEGLQAIGPYAAAIAEIEGLTAHKQAVTFRLDSSCQKDSKVLDPHSPMGEWVGRGGNLTSLIRPDLLHFSAYSSARDEAKEGKIFLNANESPWNHQPIEDIALNRYPEKQPMAVLQQLAELYKLSASQIALFRGSDEAIDLLTRLFCQAGQDAIMICPPTFGMYAICAQLQNAQIVEVPLLKEKGFQLDLSTMLQRWNPAIKLIYICSPNNPTGNVINTADILQLCQEVSGKCMIVVDEAYVDYARTETLQQHLANCDNLAILRTFSKAYGLAGARCGVLLGSSDLIQWMEKIMSPYPLSALTIQAVAQTLSDSSIKKIQQQIAWVKQERDQLYQRLLDFPWIKKVYPSEANYLFVEVKDAPKIMQACMHYGIVLRSFHAKVGLQNCIRITVGLTEENQKLIQVLQGIAL
jgi:histidinol dehydrogenase